MHHAPIPGACKVTRAEAAIQSTFKRAVALRWKQTLKRKWMQSRGSRALLSSATVHCTEDSAYRWLPPCSLPMMMAQ